MNTMWARPRPARCRTIPWRPVSARLAVSVVAAGAALWCATGQTFAQQVAPLPVSEPKPSPARSQQPPASDGVHPPGDDGHALFDQGRFAEAAQAFRRQLASQPGRADLQNNLAAALAGLGDYDGARHWLESAVRLDPWLTRAHRNLGDTYSRLAAMAYERASSSAREVSTVAVTQPAAPSGDNASRPAPQTRASPASDERAGLAMTNPRQTSGPASAVLASLQPSVVGPMLDAVEQAEDVAAVARSVRAWAKAWSERNIDAYVASYEAGFRTAGQSHEGWVALRTRRIQGARRIAVDLQQLRVSLNGDEAYVRFRQHYTSDRHTAVDEKALMLRRDERGTWLIARELVRPPTVDTSTAETPAVHVGPGVTSRS